MYVLYVAVWLSTLYQPSNNNTNMMFIWYISICWYIWLYDYWYHDVYISIYIYSVTLLYIEVYITDWLYHMYMYWYIWYTSSYYIYMTLLYIMTDWYMYIWCNIWLICMYLTIYVNILLCWAIIIDDLSQPSSFSVYGCWRVCINLRDWYDARRYFLAV